MAGNPEQQSQGGEIPKDPEQIRFQVELEFVQCLANPHYLNFLAQRGYFKDKKFVNYLNYLQYWREPPYAKYLKFPQSLHFLELLQYEHFRREVANAQCVKFIEDQQLLHWQHYTRRRMRLQQSHLENLQQHQQQQQQQQQQLPPGTTAGGNIPGVAATTGGVVTTQAGSGSGIMQAPLPPQQLAQQHSQQLHGPQSQQHHPLGAPLRGGQVDTKTLQGPTPPQQMMK